MEKKYPVITISREYAAYGRTIAAALSERLGIPFYDKDFVKETVKQSGFSEEDVEQAGEDLSRRSKLMNTLLATTYTSSHDAIFKAQREVVLKLAQEPCIIVGRCADHILREEGVDSFDIFLFADLEHRIVRAAQLEENKGLDVQDIKKIIAKKDARRSAYYKQYTGKEMGYYQNYNICLDTGRIGIDKCVDLLCEILQQ